MCTKTFGELSKEQKIELFSSWLDGNVIQVKFAYDDEDDWVDCVHPSWLEDIVYRVKPKPVVKPKIPWEHINPKWKWFAFDSNGKGYFYTEKPEKCSQTGCWGKPGAPNSSLTICKNSFLTFEKTCDWQDSLVGRD